MYKGTMIKFIRPKSQRDRIKDGLNRRFDQIHQHCRFILGPEVEELEARLSEYVGVKHTVACSNGTDALILSLMALRVVPGDEVICPDFSFFATSECISILGARPIFVDINPQTYNLNPQQLANKINKKTVAVISVNLYGQCADYDEINAICSKQQIPVIEDAAQSFGARYKGKKSCQLTTMATTSFYPSKPLGAHGDAGAVFTDDPLLAHKLRELRNHGMQSRYFHTSVGMNSRMDSYQAAVLLEKLDIFDDEIEWRQEVAGRYDKALKDDKVIIPFVESHNLSVYAQYTIRVKQREHLIQQMQQKGIPVRVHYPCPLSFQPLYRGQYSPCVESLKASQEVLSLPFHPYLSPSDQDVIIAEVQKFIKAHPTPSRRSVPPPLSKGL